VKCLPAGGGSTSTPIFAVLSHHKRGPLADCKPEQHASTKITKFLPGESAPEGWWHGWAEPAADDRGGPLRPTG